MPEGLIQIARKKQKPHGISGRRRQVMIDIPLGKALVPVDSGILANCYACEIYGSICKDTIILACCSNERKDGQNVIFKLVDYPAAEGKG
jgi:hypothetical protein